MKHVTNSTKSVPLTSCARVSPTVVSIFIPDLEELQSKSVIRNLLMKYKFSTFPNRKQLLNKYSSALPMTPSPSIGVQLINNQQITNIFDQMLSNFTGVNGPK